MTETFINWYEKGEHNKCPHLLPYESFEKKITIGSQKCQFCPYYRGFKKLNYSEKKHDIQIAIECDYMECH